MALYELTSGKDFVKLGDKVFSEYLEVPTRPFHFNNWLFTHIAEYEVAYWLDSDPAPKVLNKKLHEYFGSKIGLRLNAALYNTFIKANFPKEVYFAMNRHGKYWNTFDPDTVKHAVKNKHLIDQAVKDRTINLIPLMLVFEEDTQQLRKRFGKGVWKQLSHTSKTRMRYLAPLIKSSSKFLEVRTGILEIIARHKDLCLTERESVIQSTIVAAKVSPRIADFHTTEHVIRDTLRMAQRQGSEVNYNWSYRRWQEEHESLARDTQSRSFSDKKFTEDCIFTEGGYTFTLLTSKLDVATEGKTMHHCVASYAGLAGQGKYAVFKVDGKERATLGLRVSPTGCTLNQCYGPSNSEITGELRQTLPKIVRMYDAIVRLRNGRTPERSDEDTRNVVDGLR